MLLKATFMSEGRWKQRTSFSRQVIYRYYLKQTENKRRLETTEDEAFHDFYSSVNRLIVSITKSRILRWAGHVANVGSKRNNFRVR